MEIKNSPLPNRASQLPRPATPKQRRSGYEPSDTETEWQETPRHERDRKIATLGFEEERIDSPINPKSATISRRHHSSRFEYEYRLSSNAATGQFPGSVRRRHHSKSPYKPQRVEEEEEEEEAHALPLISGLDLRRNLSPLSKPDLLKKHLSPYRAGRGEDKDEKSYHMRRSVTAPRLRGKEKDQQLNDYGQKLQRKESASSPMSKGEILKQREDTHLRTPSVGEINEMVAKAKLSRSSLLNNTILESTESISPGDIFFSRECNALPVDQKPKIVSQRSAVSSQRIRENGRVVNTPNRGTSSSNGLSQTTTHSSSLVSRQSSGRLGTGSSKMSDASGKTSDSLRKFTANRRKSQKDGWFACMRQGSCSKSKSPECFRTIDESSYIERALVTENLRQFWADKHQPASLNGFTCHKEEAELLKELVEREACPHILFKGPPGSGKRALAMALLREIYGDACWNVSHDLKSFQIQERRHAQVVVPITSSSHHVELNVKSEPYAKYALMGIIKEISSELNVTPEVSNVNSKADYKVIVLYEVDKAPEAIQYLIKWIIDSHSDVCKLILCCEDDMDILSSVKSRFRIINVDAPRTQEIMEVLNQIARKEDFGLSTSFATRIVTKSKQNLREAIMALEACKAHNYPFLYDQPIPLGWEEILTELAAEILADPSHSRLFLVRGKFQKLLVDFVHPKLILQKLVEQFLKRIDSSLKRELYYWHAYYDKRLPPGTTAMLKLEEFVAKFMSIYRRSSGNQQPAVLI